MTAGWRVRARTAVTAHWCDDNGAPICGQRRIVKGWEVPPWMWPPSKEWGMFCSDCLDAAEAGWIVCPPEEQP